MGDIHPSHYPLGEQALLLIPGENFTRISEPLNFLILKKITYKINIPSDNLVSMFFSIHYDLLKNCYSNWNFWIS